VKRSRRPVVFKNLSKPTEDEEGGGGYDISVRGHQKLLHQSVAKEGLTGDAAKTREFFNREKKLERS